MSHLDQCGLPANEGLLGEATFLCLLFQRPARRTAAIA
jgi:hypothetical protein